MSLNVNNEVLYILRTLHDAGFEAYIVGGAVRDLLMNAHHKTNQKIVDFDFTTNATPEQIIALFPNSFYENEFGTVSIAPKHVRELMGLPAEIASEIVELQLKKRVIDYAGATKIHESLSAPNQNTSHAGFERNYEITTFRSEGTYEDHRRPSEVSWGKSLEEDLSRRDFTINAMAIALKTYERVEIDEQNYEVIDPFHGMEDVKNHLIRTVGDPAKRFKEDALRMLRAIRFSVQLNMKLTDEIFAAISVLAPDIRS